MESFDDKSEGKKSIHRPKTMFTKYLILAISFGEKNLDFYVISVCCYSTFSKFAKINTKKCKE